MKSKVVLIDTERAFRVGLKYGRELDQLIHRAHKDLDKYLKHGLNVKRTKREERAAIMLLAGLATGLGPVMRDTFLDDSTWDGILKIIPIQPNVERVFESVRKELIRRQDAAPKRRRRVR